MEIWIDAAGFPSHEISTYGRVRNKKNGHILKPIVDKDGYLRLSIGNIDNVPIHRLVAKSFYGEPDDDRTCVNHIDCNRQNNHILNLEWCSVRDNVRWGVYKGTIDPSKGLSRAIEANNKAVRIRETDQIFKSVKDCAEYIGVPPTRVSRCLSGSRKGQRLHGYHIDPVIKEDQ